MPFHQVVMGSTISIHGVCSLNTVPLDVPNPSSTSPSGPRKPTKWNQQMTHLSQPRKSTWIRHQNQLGNSKVVLCYIQKKRLSRIYRPGAHFPFKPMTRNAIYLHGMCSKSTRNVLKFSDSGSCKWGGVRGSWAHTTLEFFFFISSWWSFFSFFSHKNFVKCVFGLRTTHSTFGFPTENNQIWCLFAPPGGHFKIIEFTKKVGSVSKRIKGVCHIVALPFTLKTILRQIKNYGNSSISPCKKNIIFKKKIL